MKKLLFLSLIVSLAFMANAAVGYSSASATADVTLAAASGSYYIIEDVVAIASGNESVYLGIVSGTKSETYDMIIPLVANYAGTTPKTFVLPAGISYKQAASDAGEALNIRLVGGGGTLLTTATAVKAFVKYDVKKLGLF